MFEIFDPTFNTLERAMRISAQKQEVISHNIANANTPGYAPRVFDEILQDVVDKYPDSGRSVNLEEEMADLARNGISYSSYVKLLSSKLNILRTIATQGRR